MTESSTEGSAARVAFADQRYQQILARLRAERRVDSTELASRFGVSSESIRKDLIHLEGMGLLKRVHGGAIPVETVSYEPVVTTRTEFSREKEAIARRALALLPEQGSLIIDAGSTAEKFATLIPGDRSLKVFTNTLPIALTLVTKPQLTVHTLGGRLRHHTLAEVDDWALRALAEINVDVAFLGTNGISLERGLTTPDAPEAQIKRAMLKSARRHILLADHSKIGLISTIQHATLRDIDVLITDDGISADDLNDLRSSGLEVICAPTHELAHS